jgi:putative RecB family exonuclease
VTDPPYDWARLQEVKVQPRSVSQTSSYLEDLGGCRYRYFLSRVVKAWDRPAAWFVQGLAVHEAAEWWEKGGRTGSLNEMLKVFEESYVKHTIRLLKVSRNPEFWNHLGAATGAKDIERRALLGREMTAKYYDYYVNQKPGEVIWITPEGKPAIELGFSAMFGSVEVRGMIDQIIDEDIQDLPVDPPDVFRVMRDIKTGNKPGGIFQLSTYRFAVLDNYGVDFPIGDFWMGKLGKPTKPYKLDAMTREQVTDLYGRMDEGVKAEDFEPSPSPDKCTFCGVRSACRYAM